MDSPQSNYPIDNNYLFMTKYLVNHAFSIQNQSIEHLEQQLCMSNYIHNHLEKLENLYTYNLDNISGRVYDIEKSIRKKWQKGDKVMTGVTLGLLYPAFKVIHKQEKRLGQTILENLKNEYHTNESYKNDICRLKEQMVEINHQIEKELKKKTTFMKK